MNLKKQSLALAVLLSLGICGNAWALGEDSYAADGATAEAKDSVAVGKYAKADGNETPGKARDGGEATAIGYKASAGSSGGWFATAVGAESNAAGKSTVAVGYNSQAIGWLSTAVGNKTQTAYGSVAIGDESIAGLVWDKDAGEYKSVGDFATAIGMSTFAKADYSSAFGFDSTALAKNSVALGAGSVATEKDTVSVGSDGTESSAFTRRVVNVAAAKGDNEALTSLNFKKSADEKYATRLKIGSKEYILGPVVDAKLDEASTNTIQNGVVAKEFKKVEANAEKETSERIAADKDLQDQINNLGGSLAGDVERLDSDVKSVGAMAAAMAGLHPRFTGDGKGEVAAAIGSYDGKKATAIGGFYAPDERFMFSLGGAFAAGGKKMANLGVNIALDPKPRMSKAYYTKEISELKAANQAQAEKLEAQEAKLDAQAKQMNEQAEQIKVLMQRLAALEGR